jgi:acyl-coenzyme A thioesterase PaaI-like protein
MDQLATLAEEELQSQPFSSLLGTQLTAMESGKVTLTLSVRAELTQQHSFVHGGAISYLADNALTFAGGSMLGGNAVSGEFKRSMPAPAKRSRSWSNR